MEKSSKKNWKLLGEGCCPECGYPLKSIGLLDTIFYCGRAPACRFRIGQARYDEVTGMIKATKRSISATEEERMGLLNNLGLDEVAKDFSDSPALDK